MYSDGGETPRITLGGISDGEGMAEITLEGISDGEGMAGITLEGVSDGGKTPRITLGGISDGGGAKKWHQWRSLPGTMRRGFAILKCTMPMPGRYSKLMAWRATLLPAAPAAPH